MTASGDDGGESPADRALEAMRTAVADLEEAHATAENAAVAGAAEQEHVDEFVSAVAKALADGLNQPVGLYAGAVAEETEYYSKTDLKQQISDRVEEYRGGDKQPLGEFVGEELVKVLVVKTTDHRQGAEYIWDFGTFKVETRSGKDGRGHFRFDQFRDLIHESGGVNLARPVKDRRGGEEWRDFMVSMIDDRGEEQYTVGARTQAFEALRNKIKRLTGYGTAESALDHTGIWVVRETVDLPEWWRGLGELPRSESRDLPGEYVEQVRVHESVIKPILSDAEVTRSAFYHELNARNLTVPWTNGASMTEWVNGSEERFWTLLPDAGTPEVYVPDPNTADEPARSLLESPGPDGPGGQEAGAAAAAVETDGSGETDDDGDDADDGDGFDSVGDIQ